MDIKTLQKTLGDVKTEALIHTLHDNPPKENAEGLNDTFWDIVAEALVYTLAETPLERKAETVGDTMGDVKNKPSNPVGKTEAG